MKIVDFIKDEIFDLPKSQTDKEDFKKFVFKTFDKSMRLPDFFSTRISPIISPNTSL